MKTTVLTLTFLALSTLSYAQRNPIDFEEDGFGATWTWNVFENDTNPALEFIANPDPSGINTSARVARFTALAGGQPWAGAESAHGATNLGTFVLGQNNSTIKIMVWKSVISDVGIKLVAESGWAMIELKKPNTKINEWEELTFDFSAYPNPPAEEGQYDQIVVFPDFNLDGRGQNNTIYFDNITFSESSGTPATAPTTTAPAPTRNADNVISLYAQGYTNRPVDTWRTDWSAAVYSEVDIAGRMTKRYVNLDFVGIETVANQVDVSGMSHIHLDVWSADFTQFGIKLVDFGADGAFGGGDDTEYQVNLPGLPQGQWVNLDIPLANFTTLAGKKNIAQIILVGQPSGSTTVFVDNVYFFDDVEGEGPSVPVAAAPAPTRDAANVISLYAQGYTNRPVDTWRTDWSAANYAEVDIAGRLTKVYANLDFVGIETVANQINISEMTHLHVNIWSANLTNFGIKLVDFGADGAFGGGDDTEHQINIANPTQGEWVSLNLPLSDFTGMTGRNNLAQIILVGQPTGSANVFVDNMYFYKETSTSNEEFSGLPNGFELKQNFPNPFNPSTNISYAIPASSHVTLEVFNIQGQKVATLVNGFQNSGAHMVTFDASKLASWVYMYRLTSGNMVKVNKMMLVK